MLSQIENLLNSKFFITVHSLQYDIVNVYFKVQVNIVQ